MRGFSPKQRAESSPDNGACGLGVGGQSRWRLGNPWLGFPGPWSVGLGPGSWSTLSSCLLKCSPYALLPHPPNPSFPAPVPSQHTPSPTLWPSSHRAVRRTQRPGLIQGHLTGSLKGVEAQFSDYETLMAISY